MFRITPAFAAVLLLASPAKAQRVTASRTPTTHQQAYGAICAALGDDCDSDTATLLTAQWAHETDRGRRMWNYNFAGIKRFDRKRKYCLLRTFENVTKDGRKTWMLAAFRAYDNLYSGAADFVNVLAADFPDSYTMALDGNVSGYANALKSEGYYTAPPRTYTRALARHIEETKEKVHGGH